MQDKCINFAFNFGDLEYSYQIKKKQIWKYKSIFGRTMISKKIHALTYKGIIYEKKNSEKKKLIC